MKESLPKSGRWFSWMESAHAMLREWWASRMILEWYLGFDVPDPDECVMGKFKDLRAGKGGLKLVHAVLSRSNWENCHVLLVCNRPLWDWYTVQVTELKTAHDAVDYAVHMSTRWCHDEQFFKLAKALSHDHDGIEVFRMLAEWTHDESRMSSKILGYVVSLMGTRASSLSKHTAPPLRYAQALCRPITDDAVRETLQVMKSDWAILTACETASAIPEQLTADLSITMDGPTRLMMLLCESIKFQNMPDQARQILSIMLKTLPDSKIIEDLHQKVRLAQKMRASHEKMKVQSIQHLINSSPVLSSRELNHPVALTKEFFLNNLRGTKRDFNCRVKSYGRRHKLPRSYGEILDTKKTWQSVTPVSLARSSAAWAWVREFKENRLKNSGFSLKDGSLSTF